MGLRHSFHKHVTNVGRDNLTLKIVFLDRIEYFTLVLLQIIIDYI